MSTVAAEIKNPIEVIREPVRDDLAAVDKLILSELFSDVPLIQTITQYIIKSGGKRMRPLIVLLCARAAGYQTGTEHHELATIIEFVHTATLLHDDVVDESTLRRGKETANAAFGNQASVLVGDFLYSRSFQMLCRRSNVPVMQVLSGTTNAIAEGEVMQLMNRHDTELNEQSYLQVIDYKTAKLFQAAAQIGAMIATDDTNNLHQAAATYGQHLGLAFQIIDDLLDYTADESQLGKHVGDDLAEGKMTLPLIYTKQQSDANTRKLIDTAIHEENLAQITAILNAMKACNAFDYCLSKAKQHLAKAQQALQQFPATPYRDSLQKLLQFTVERHH